MSRAPRREVEVAGWHDAAAAVRDEGFDFFDWLTAVDQSDADPGTGTPGLDLVCHLLNSTSRGALSRVLLRTRVPLAPERQNDAGRSPGETLTLEEAPAVASITDLYAGAAWHERETHEMFGIDFVGFDDGTGLGIRPLLLPDGFEGTPLRKSFVLAARASKPWPGAKEPGEGGGEQAPSASPGRRRLLPPGVPDAGWGPR